MEFDGNLASRSSLSHCICDAPKDRAPPAAYPLLDKPLFFAVDAKFYRIEQIQLDFLAIRSPAESTSPNNRSRLRGHAGNHFGLK